MDSVMTETRPAELSAWPDLKDGVMASVLNPAWLWGAGSSGEVEMVDGLRCGEEDALRYLAVIQGRDALPPSLSDHSQAGSLTDSASDQYSPSAQHSPAADQVFVLDVTAACSPDSTSDMITLDSPPQLVSAALTELISSAPAVSVATSAPERVPISMLLPFPGQGATNQIPQGELTSQGLSVVNIQGINPLAQAQTTTHFTSGSSSPYQQQPSPYQDPPHTFRGPSPYNHLSQESMPQRPETASPFQGAPSPYQGTHSPYPGSPYKSDSDSNPGSNTLGADGRVQHRVSLADALPPLSRAPSADMMGPLSSLPTISLASQPPVTFMLTQQNAGLPSLTQAPMTVLLNPPNMALPPLSQAGMDPQNTQNILVNPRASLPQMSSAVTMTTFTGGSVLDTVPMTTFTGGSVLDTVPMTTFTGGSVLDTVPMTTFTAGSVLDTVPMTTFTAGSVLDTVPMTTFTGGSVLDTVPMPTFTAGSVLDTVPMETILAPKAVLPASAEVPLTLPTSDTKTNTTDNKPQRSRGAPKRQKVSPPAARPTPRAKRTVTQTRGRGVKKNASYLPPCKVCQAPGTGYHYGVTTCEACKGFFRRCLTRKHEPVCSGDGLGSCDISFGIPNACPSCRYQKCMEVGMSVKAIRLGRYTLTKKTQDIIEVKHLEAQQQQQDRAHARSSEIESFVSEVITSHREIMDYWQNTPGLENMEQIKQQHALSRLSAGGANCPSSHLSPEDFIALYRKTGIKVDERIKDMSIWGEFFESGLTRLVSFMKRVPGFKSLGPSDQLHLIKCSYLESVMLGRQDLFDIAARVYIGADGDRIHPFPLDLVVGEQVASSLLLVAQKLQKLKPSYEETCLLKLLNIFSSERHNFESPESIEATHAQCLDALLYTIERNPPAGTTCSPNLRFAKMAEIITLLRSLNHELSHYFKKTVLTFTESQLLTLPPLFNEIVKSI